MDLQLGQKDRNIPGDWLVNIRRENNKITSILFVFMIKYVLALSSAPLSIF